MGTYPAQQRRQSPYNLRRLSFPDRMGTYAGILQRMPESGLHQRQWQILHRRLERFLKIIKNSSPVKSAVRIPKRAQFENSNCARIFLSGFTVYQHPFYRQASQTALCQRERRVRQPYRCQAGWQHGSLGRDTDGSGRGNFQR